MNKLHIVFLLFILYANCPWEDPLLSLHGDSGGRLRGLEDHLQAVPRTPGPSWRFAKGEEEVVAGK